MDFQFLQNKYKDIQHKFKLTGSPRVDVWRYVRSKKISYRSDILINTNFGACLAYRRLFQADTLPEGGAFCDLQLVRSLVELWQTRMISEFLL